MSISLGKHESTKKGGTVVVAALKYCLYDIPFIPQNCGEVTATNPRDCARLLHPVMGCSRGRVKVLSKRPGGGVAMAPEAAIDQAFRRVEEIFTKYPITQS